MATTSPGPAIAASFRFLGPAWSKAPGSLLAMIAASAGYRLATAAAPSLTLLWAVLFFGFSLYLGTMLGGALYRIGLAADHANDPQFRLGPAGFQWGQIEWRVLGARVLFAVLVGGAMLFVFLVWAITLGLLIQSGHVDARQITSVQGYQVLLRLMTSRAGPVTALILGPGLLVVLYIYARLLLLIVMAAETGHYGLGRAIALSRGATLTIMLGAMVIWIVEFLLGAVGGGIAGFARGFIGTMIAAPTGRGAGAYWGALVGGALGAAYSGPASIGLITYVYRRQRGDASSVADAFS